MFVDADFALAEALEPAAFDEPAGGDFDASIRRGVGRDVGVKDAEGIELSAVDEGVLLMVDAVAETSLASWTRHKELRRRADEEMALVAEELGA